MRYKLNVALLVEAENTGNVIRNVGADVYMNSSDGVSLDYLKQSLVELCNGLIDNINDIGGGDKWH